ncbi:MAG: hypothetical protein OEM02_15050, partial [Desulfobulbaceae bacterium]|nr:hypothetical protein [Desulfobulbaceae bacterium]
LATALDGVCWRGKGKKIRIMGNSQLAIPFMLGQYFNRSTHAMLFCSNNDGTVFTNEEQDWYAPLTGGNADCLSTEDAVPALPKDWKSDSVCLLLGRGYLIPDVQEYLAQHPELPSLLWVENGTFNDNQEAMQYVADVVALLLKIKKDAGVRTVYLFCGLPFILLPILSANLHHVMNRVFFMEHGKDLQESSMSTRDMYSVC